MAAGRAWFRLLHGQRLLACQTGWMCQVCGRVLPPRGWLVVGENGYVVTSAAMH